MSLQAVFEYMPFSLKKEPQKTKLGTVYAKNGPLFKLDDILLKRSHEHVTSYNRTVSTISSLLFLCHSSNSGSFKSHFNDVAFKIVKLYM